VYLLHSPIPHKSFYATSELIDIQFLLRIFISMQLAAQEDSFNGQIPSNLSAKVIK